MDQISIPSKPAGVQRGKITWPNEQSKPQNFSLPSSIIYDIAKNPSNPTVYLKLAQSCKYFFEKLPLLIAKDVYGKSRFCINTAKECLKNSGKCCVVIDFTKLSSKIWLTNEIRITNINVIPKYVSLLTSKLYRPDVTTLRIQNKHVTFNDFIFMASSAKIIALNDVKIIYKDGNNATLDAILEAVPYVEESYCSSPIISSSTLKNISKLQNLTQMRDLWLYDIVEIANIDDFMNVIKKLKRAKIILDFDDNISEGLKNQLNDLIDTVIKDETLKCLIRYNRQEAEKLKLLQKRLY